MNRVENVSPCADDDVDACCKEIHPLVRAGCRPHPAACRSCSSSTFSSGRWFEDHFLVFFFFFAHSVTVEWGRRSRRSSLAPPPLPSGPLGLTPLHALRSGPSGRWLRFPFSQTTTSAGAVVSPSRLVAYCVPTPGFQSSTHAVHSPHTEDSGVFLVSVHLMLHLYRSDTLTGHKHSRNNWFHDEAEWFVLLNAARVKKTFLLVSESQSSLLRSVLGIVANIFSFHCNALTSFCQCHFFVCTLCYRAFLWLIRNTSLCCC